MQFDEEQWIRPYKKDSFVEVSIEDGVSNCESEFCVSFISDGSNLDLLQSCQFRKKNSLPIEMGRSHHCGADATMT